MKDRTLSRTDIRMLLDALAERLHEKRAFAKLHIVGGACLALAYERERTTEDIDVRVDAGHEALEAAIREIAQEHDLPERWLNDQARGFIPEGDDARSPTLYESQSLVVTGASGEYLLASRETPSTARNDSRRSYQVNDTSPDFLGSVTIHREPRASARRGRRRSACALDHG